MELAARAPHPALAPHIRGLAGPHERAGATVRRELGLAPTAHFNRDFKAFAGMTPTGYRAVTSVQDIQSVPA